MKTPSINSLNSLGVNRISESFILQKISERSLAKKKGNFKLADKIRNELLDNDVIIEDQKEKTIWKYK